jgi:hypothetical protein
MAFGQKDTDAIFKILRKTLAPLGINAQRVDPSDETFPGRLTRRVTRVIAPLVRSRVASEAAKERRLAFERLSTVEKAIFADFNAASEDAGNLRDRELIGPVERLPI